MARPAAAGVPDRHVSYGPHRSSSGRRCSTRATTSSTRHQRQHDGRLAGVQGRGHDDVRAAPSRRLRNHTGRQPAGGTSERWTTPTPAGLPGILSVPQAFNWTDTSALRGPERPHTPVPTSRSRSNGTGILNGGNGCKDPMADPNASFICTGVPTTPVLSWDPVPGRHVVPPLRCPGPELHHQRDEQRSSRRSTRCVALRMGDQTSTLPESQAGSAYFWHVTACGTNGCMTSPVSQNPPLQGSEAFRKASPGRRRTQHVEPQRERDHLLAGRTTTTPTRPRPGTASSSNQTAQHLPDPGRQRPVVLGSTIDTATVDQTTFTAPDRSTPTAPTTGASRLSTKTTSDSPGRPSPSFTKASPAVVPSSPVGGAVVVRHDAVPLDGPAVRGVVHGRGLQEQRPVLQRRQPGLHRHGQDDGRRSGVSRSPRPARHTSGGSGGTDASGNLGPWSNPQAFFSSRVRAQPAQPQGRRLGEAAEAATSSGPRCRAQRATR